MGSRLVVLALVIAAAAADWPQFRGPTGDGVAEGISLPEKWDAKTNLAWKAEIPGYGWSQPIILGDAIYLTTAVGTDLQKPKGFMAGVMEPQSMGKGPKQKPLDKTFRWQLVKLNRANGKVEWTKTAYEGKPKLPIHPSNSFATESPAADNQRIVAYFGNIGLLMAWDKSGKELWKKELPVGSMTADFGTGSSLVLFEGKVFVQNYTEEDATLSAWDAATGQELWTSHRPVGSAWSSPLIWKTKNRTDLVSSGRGLVIGYDPKTGKERWKLGNIQASFSSSPAATEDLLFVGNGGPGTNSPLYAIKAGAEGDISLKEGETSNAHVLWYKTGAGPGMPSPIAHGDYLYVLNTAGLNCFEAKTGKLMYKERLPKVKTLASCPFLANGKLYILDESGQMFVVKAGPEFEVLGVNTISDTFWSSPAVAGSDLLLRGLDGLYCIRGK
ncbi:PQQ-binding-like beta-propeller repeat protein [Telmatocola sphagniphila]|uniref:PQQ-binding-like beta-propeller repeat protein n=1 Tax=Telmatocola sphagniphila TaxID=1123043 RepID=A0A8E6B7X0_9BACT|nr:PQQ-binding-like beta-propeller repeat protein [Telmatocola sphagniphila]QVL33522.1 PQQ-binding-like beta-propeller repeat protein [Telmatocola sphagniphila]